MYHNNSKNISSLNSNGFEIRQYAICVVSEDARLTAALTLTACDHERAERRCKKTSCDRVTFYIVLLSVVAFFCLFFCPNRSVQMCVF